jgi:ankyrin repeat protein
MSSFEQINEDIYYKNEEAALAKLETYREDINNQDVHGWTLLHWSVSRCDKVAKKILDMGADSNTKPINGWTALHEAVYWENLKSVTVLVEAGADLSIETIYDKETALDLAIRKNYTNIVEYLEIPLTKRTQ